MQASIPPWVPVLFLVLLFLGYRLSRPRRVRPGPLVALALAMLGFSLYGVFGAFGPQPLVLLFWAGGYAAALTLGVRYFEAGGLRAEAGAVQLPASWAPMGLMMGIFAAKFVLGFAAGIRSPMLQQPGFVAAMSALLGAFSGGFGARALAVHRASRRIA